VIFSDVFKDYYPEVIDPLQGSLVGLPQEPAVTVVSRQRLRTAIVMRTDGSTVPYEQALGRIEVSGDDQPLTVIRVHGFRTVDVRWINDRLLHIDLGLGHVAAVEAIYDLQAQRWLYQDSLTYPP
jgi:hypothetical protein